MANKYLYFLFIISIIAVNFAGCDSNKNVTQLNEAHAKISQLTSENQKLSKQNKELLQDQETLMINQKELEEWVKKLVDGYGPGVWYMDELTMPIFVKPVSSGDIKEIINELNRMLEHDGLPLITLAKTKGNIAYVRIDNTHLLTQQMGTHGATSYMNAVTYSLASVNKIDCVIFDFEEGDHAIPGKYCK